MRWNGVAIVGAIVLSVFAVAANGQNSLLKSGGVGKVAGGGAIPFALDGTSQFDNTGGSGSTIVLPAFSTTYTNDIIYILGYDNSNTAMTMTVADTALKLTSTTLRTSSNTGTPTNLNILRYATLSSALSSDVVTITFGGTGSFINAGIFAFSGIHAASPFDTNGAIPDAPNNATCDFTTTNANDILIGMGLSGSSTPDSGYTLINGTQDLFVEYKSVTSAQSFLGAPNTNSASICDAVIKGP